MNIPTVNTACSLIEVYTKAVMTDGFGEIFDGYIEFAEIGKIVYVTVDKDLPTYEISLLRTS